MTVLADRQLQFTRQFSFLLGIGVGAEYPCGSVSASEQSEEKGNHKNAQHRWFALATSTIKFTFYSSVLLTITNYLRCDDWFRLRCLSICASGSILDVGVSITQHFQPSDLIQLRWAPPSSCLAAVFGIGGCSCTSCVHLASIHGRAHALQEGLHETC